MAVPWFSSAVVAIRYVLPVLSSVLLPFDRGKGKCRVLNFLYSAAYAMAGPARFTISEVAVDWQEPLVLQRKLWPSNCTR